VPPVATNTQKLKVDFPWTTIIGEYLRIGKIEKNRDRDNNWGIGE